MLPLSGLEGGDASEEASSNAAVTTVVNQQRNQAEQKLREEVMPFFRQSNVFGNPGVFSVAFLKGLQNLSFSFLFNSYVCRGFTPALKLSL